MLHDDKTNLAIRLLAKFREDLDTDIVITQNRELIVDDKGVIRRGPGKNLVIEAYNVKPARDERGRLIETTVCERLSQCEWVKLSSFAEAKEGDIVRFRGRGNKLEIGGFTDVATGRQWTEVRDWLVTKTQYSDANGQSLRVEPHDGDEAGALD